MNQHIEKAALDDLQVVKALGAGGFGLVKLVKVKGKSKNRTKTQVNHDATCTLTIISDRFVITAAHCINEL